MPASTDPRTALEKALDGVGSAFIFLTFEHYRALTEVDPWLDGHFPALPRHQVDLSSVDATALRDALAQIDNGIVLLRGAERLLEKPESASYLNLHRDRLASKPVKYIFLMDGEANLRGIETVMCDLWSYRTLIQHWNVESVAVSPSSTIVLPIGKEARLPAKNGEFETCFVKWAGQLGPKGNKVLREPLFQMLLEMVRAESRPSEKLAMLARIGREAEKWGIESKGEMLAMLLNEKGAAFSDNGQYDLAIQQYETALAIDRKVFGDKHPSVANCLNNLGWTWNYKGEYDKAIGYFEQAIEIGREVFGERHPSAIIRLNNLGSAWYAKGEYGKAIGYFDKALVISRNVFGKKHPHVAVTLNHLGSAWKAEGEHMKAIECYEKALDIDRKVLGAEHPDVATGLSNLASVREMTGDYDAAIGLYGKALAIHIRFFGEQHPTTQAVRDNLEEARRRLRNTGFRTPP